MLLWLLVTHVDKTLGIMSKRKERCSFFLKFTKTSTIFATINVAIVVEYLTPGKASLLKNL